LNIQYVFIAFKYYLAETKVVDGVQPDFAVMSDPDYPDMEKASYKRPHALPEALFEGAVLN
jgi:hypothetical protein